MLLKRLNRKDLLINKAFINGEWISSSENTFSVIDPSSLEKLIDMPSLSTKETRFAIKCAYKTFHKQWKFETPLNRSQLLHKWFKLIMDNKSDLATIMTAECGKPTAEALGEVQYAADFVQFYAHECMRQDGFMIPNSNVNERLMAFKQPVGVAAIITPWNFPLAMITRKVAPCLAAGCTAVVKPPPDTPLSAVALAKLAEEAGFPAGVLNVVTGSKDEAIAIGTELSTNTFVKKLSFTGSTSVGKTLMQQASGTVKKVSLELGGNAPFIIFSDADVDAAVSGAMASKFRNSGQTCISSNRFFIQENVYDEFVEKFSAMVMKLKVGPGFDENINVGPVINNAAINKIKNLVDDAVNKGAKIICGGNIISKDNPTMKGFFYAPTILSNITSDMIIASNEIFGPVAPLVKFKTEDEVIKLANATNSGLAGYFYSENIGRAWRVATALEYGMIGVNTGKISTVQAPFGGCKESGIGREGSIIGMDEYLETKFVCMAALGK